MGRIKSIFLVNFNGNNNFDEKGFEFLKEKDNMSRLKEIISRTLIQNVMESNFVEFENWANLSEASFYYYYFFLYTGNFVELILKLQTKRSIRQRKKT